MNKTIKTLSLIVFAFFISQNLYSQLFIKKIDNKDIEIVEKAIPAKCISSLYDYIRIDKRTKEPLRGKYKVIVNKDEYYKAFFEEGNLVVKNKINLVKYYYKGKYQKLYIYVGKEYILLSKNDSDKKEGLIDVKYFNYSDIDEKEPNSTTKDNKKELEGRLKVFIPLIKEKDIKEFLKDFQFRFLKMVMGRDAKR